MIDRKDTLFRSPHRVREPFSVQKISTKYDPHDLGRSNLAESCWSFRSSVTKHSALARRTQLHLCAIARRRFRCLLSPRFCNELSEMTNLLERDSGRFASAALRNRLACGCSRAQPIVAAKRIFVEHLSMSGWAQNANCGPNFGTIFWFPFLGPLRRNWLGRSQKWEPKTVPKLEPKIGPETQKF